MSKYMAYSAVCIRLVQGSIPLCHFQRYAAEQEYKYKQSDNYSVISECLKPVFGKETDKKLDCKYRNDECNDVSYDKGG